MNKFGKYSFMIDLDEVCFINIDPEKKRFYVVFKSGHSEFLQFPDEMDKNEIEKIGQEMYKKIQNTRQRREINDRESKPKSSR